MSDSNRVQLACAEEVVYGETVSGRKLNQMRFTSETLQQEISTTSSKEIRSDRQIADVIRTNVKAPGQINFELSFAAQDDHMRAALMADSDWSMPKTVTATTYSASSTDNSFNDSGSGFATAGLIAGMYIRTSGFATAADNGLFKIVTAAVGKLTVSGGTLVTEAAGASVTIARCPRLSGTTYSMASSDNSINDSGTGFVTAGFTAHGWVKISGFTTAANNGFFKIISVVAGKMVLAGLAAVVIEAVGDTVTIVQGSAITNGVTGRSYNIERQYTDLTNVFSLYPGMMVDQMALNVATEAVITGSFTFLGAKEIAGSASNGSGYDAAPTNEVMNAVDNVLAFFEGGSSSGCSAKSFTLQLQNALRARLRIGTLGAFSVGAGAVAVSGALQAYFETQALLDKVLDFTATSLATVIQDAAGNAYVIDLPRVKYTKGPASTSGSDTDIMVDLSYMAYRHPTESVTIRIVRFPI